MFSSQCSLWRRGGGEEGPGEGRGTFEKTLQPRNLVTLRGEGCAASITQCLCLLIILPARDIDVSGVECMPKGNERGFRGVEGGASTFLLGKATPEDEHDIVRVLIDSL